MKMVVVVLSMWMAAGQPVVAAPPGTPERWPGSPSVVVATDVDSPDPCLIFPWLCPQATTDTDGW